MNEPRYDVIGIGNAIVDVMSSCEDSLIEELMMAKGGMMLVDEARARELYDAMGPAREISGGSAANTLAGLSVLGSQCAFVGQVAKDQLGDVFAHDIRAAGIDFDTPPSAEGPATARCLIFVTPDAQRTMNTYLGASQHLPAAAIDSDMIASASILYLEGYLWDSQTARSAMRTAMAAARAAGRKVAFTLSDVFVIDRHGDDFRALLEEGLIDILFANEAELKALAGVQALEDGLQALAHLVSVLVVTRSAEGAVAIAGPERVDIAAEPVETVVDTTGAGDLFAAGFLHGYCEGLELALCLRLGALAASEVISHYGARPEADLRALAADLQST